MTPRPEVIAAAQAAQAATRVPASVSIAQFALESGWGAHMPPGSNNPFGVKDFHSADAVWAMTTEVIAGRVIHERQPFRRYASLADAFTEHAELLARSPVYAPAMAALPDLAAFVAAMARRYATDPDYADKILALIGEGDLERYDAASA